MSSPIEIQAFQCTIPLGTPQNAPVHIAMSMPPRIVTAIEVTIPPGPDGTVGFALSSGGIQFLPANAGAFIVASKRTILWQLARQLESGAWELTGYNTGIYDHTIYLEFSLALIGSQVQSVPAFQPMSALSST